MNRARTNDPRFQSSSLLSSVDKIEAVDNKTVRFTLKEPDVVTLRNLSVDSLLVMAPEVVDKADKFATADTGVGTGPFILQSATDNVGAEYVRNSDYWKPGLPYLDGVRTQHFENEQLARAAFVAGAIDVTRLPGTEVKQHIAQQGAGYKPDWFKDDTGLQVMPNVRTAPFNDARLARAMRLLIDHDEFIKTWAEVWTGSGSHGSIFTPAIDTWDLTQDEYKTYREWQQPKTAAVREALSLLGAAGYTKDNPLKFELVALSDPSFSPAMMELLQAQWKQLSGGVVDPTVRAFDAASFNTLRSRGTFSYMVVGVSGGTNDPDSFLSQIYRSGGSKNYGGYADTTLDTMIDKQRVTFDTAQRKAQVKEIVKYMIDKSPYAIPSNRLWLTGVAAKVRDIAPEYHMNGRQYERVWFAG
jgi:peptide/nickel transport system substrate-binding protein